MAGSLFQADPNGAARLCCNCTRGSASLHRRATLRPSLREVKLTLADAHAVETLIRNTSFIYGGSETPVGG